MGWFSKAAPKQTGTPAACATQLRYGSGQGWGPGWGPGFAPAATELRLYRTLRASVPLIDAAVNKLVRLVGGFDVRCSGSAEAALRRFLREVPVGYGQRGVEQFLTAWLGGLLTDGCAVGEMVVQDGHLTAVCWGDVAEIELQSGDSPLDTVICTRQGGQAVPLPRQHLLLLSTLISGFDVLYQACVRLVREHRLGEELLVSIAAILAFTINEGYEAAAVMLI